MAQRTRCVAVLLAILIAVTGCARAAAPQEEEATPTPIPTPIVPVKPTYQVQRGEVIKSIQFTGRIAPVVEEELFFRTSGYVGTVYVKRNQQVKTGDLLGELETTDLQNQLAQAQAELEAIQISAGRQITEATAALKIAELRLATIRAEDPDLQVVAAEVDLERTRLALSDAQTAYDEAWDPARDWELNASRWSKEALEHEREGTERALYEAQLSLRVAQAQYDQALQARQIYNYNVQIQDQEVALARLRLQELLAGLDVQRAQLAVQRLEGQLADARVVAPFDGLVLSLSLTEGRLAEAYKPVAIVADVSELELSADLTDKQLQEVTEGMPVTIVPLSRPSEEFKGTIRRLPYPYGGGGRSTGVEDEDKSTRVTLETPASEANFELGDLARVTVVLERKDDALWLPPQAIRTFEGRKFVVVQEGDAQLRVDVKVGIESEDRVEILEGLTEGQIVIGQ